VKEKVFILHLRTVEDLKKAIRYFFNDFQLSVGKKMSRKTWGKIYICVENGGEHTDNFYP
jgi:hypothetical protein